MSRPKTMPDYANEGTVLPSTPIGTKVMMLESSNFIFGTISAMKLDKSGEAVVEVEVVPDAAQTSHKYFKLKDKYVAKADCVAIIEDKKEAS